MAEERVESMAELALSLESVTRRFGDVTALSGLDLAIERGTVTIVLGPNGAGKTTTFRLATGVLRPTSGSVRTLGLDPTADGQTVRRRCGVVPPKPAMYDRLTGRQNLEYAARLYELDAPPIDSFAERFGILDALDRRVAGYSTGMRTRLALVRSLLHDPELLLLDEPTAGLDPESSQAVRGLLFDFTGDGKTVVMTTHLLHEADGTADLLVLMDEGKVWESGSPSDLAARYSDGVDVRIEVQGDVSSIGSLDGVRRVEPGDGVVVVTVDDRSVVPTIVARLVGSGASVGAVVPEEQTLERLYFEMRRQR